MSDSLRPHEPQQARPPCPSPTSGVHPNPCPLSQWWHPTISSSVVPFFSCVHLSQHSGTSLSLRKDCLCNQITVPEKCLWNFSFCDDPSLGTKVDRTHLAKTDLWKETASFAQLEDFRGQDKGQPFSLRFSCMLCDVRGESLPYWFPNMRLKLLSPGVKNPFRLDLWAHSV